MRIIVTIYGEGAEEGLSTEYDRMGSISDGDHTFDELYRHRGALLLALMKSHPDISWVAPKHHPEDTPIPDGYFIAGMKLPTGMISYHLPLTVFKTFETLPKFSYAPRWDGHTPNDVVKRLVDWKQLKWETGELLT
jgi:hypothetical protein